MRTHLDLAAERRVNAAVRALPMTRILVAHRPETLASADRVLTMEDGRIVAERPLKGDRHWPGETADLGGQLS